MKYAVILEHEGQFSIRMMCRVLGVSRGGYHRWRSRGESKTSKRRDLMEEKILETYETFEAIYGSRRIAEELRALGFLCSVNYVADIMKSRNIKARNGKGFVYRHHSLTMHNVADNLLWRDFKAKNPNEKWTSDITYIWVENRWVYLATVMDLFSRKIVGWALDTSMTVDLIEKALQMALDRRGRPSGVILHSDRGVQYRSQGYVDLVEQKGLTASMSRKGNCWDNAPMESFFSRLKVELIYAKNYQTMDEAKAGIFEYIEIFYNRKRRHSANDNLSPAEYEEMAAMAA